MAVLVSDVGGNAESVAAELDAQARSGIALTQQLRNAVNSTSLFDSTQAQASYQALAALASMIASQKDTPGLKEALIRRFPTHPSYDPASEYPAAIQAINAYLNWFQANWPELTATSKPAFQQFDGATKQLTGFTVNLQPAAKTALLNRLDAVLNAFAVP